MDATAEKTSSWVYLKGLIRYFAGGVWRLANERPLFLWAQAIAFKVLVSIVPIVLLATGVLGQILRGDEAFDTVAGYVRTFVPYQSEQLIGLLSQLQTASTTITVLGLAGILLAVMTLFTTFRVVIGSIFQEEYHIQRTVLRGYVFDIRMALQVGLLFLLTIGLTTGMRALDAAGAQFFQQIGYDVGWLRSTWQSLFYAFGLVLPLLLSIGMFFQLFYFIPRPPPPKRSALLGAAVTALLWDAAKHLFAFYVTRSGRFTRYSANPEPGAEEMNVLVSAFGLVLAFVFWVYYSGIVLCLGAFFSLLHEKRYRVKRKLLHASTLAGNDLSTRPARLGLPPARDLLAWRRRKAREDVPLG